MKQKFISWLLFFILSLIWGSSFILMKIGIEALSPYQVATIRILSAGIILLPFAAKAWKNIPKNKMVVVIVSGLTGSFFPAYLYCIAETKIDSSLAAILNALTPLCAIVIGILFFDLETNSKKITGVLIGFGGLCLLPFASQKGINLNDISYALLVLLATVLYGLNVNIVSKHLKQTGSLNVAALSFTFLIIPCICILAATGYFHLYFQNKNFIKSATAASVLGIFGTAIATVLFYMLVKRAGAVFASLVTYGIPFVALVWGLFAGETISIAEIGCLAVILAGVYIVNK